MLTPETIDLYSMFCCFAIVKISRGLKSGKIFG